MTDLQAISDPVLWEAFINRNRQACARLITMVENYPELVPGIRDKLIPRQNGAIRIGITGPPGVGKSTVTAALARISQSKNRNTAIIAVDPSSPFSGGAFLGDRIRMQNLVGNKNVFIRSVASREGKGGLSPATPDIADVFDAFGMEWIIIETVGVGQAELDVLECSDLIILVMQPDTGDSIQILKAGILEAADIILINKSDLPGAKATEESLRFLFEVKCNSSGKHPRLLAGSAENGTGMADLYKSLEDTIAELKGSGLLTEKRRKRQENEVRHFIEKSLWKAFISLPGIERTLKTRINKAFDTNTSPYPPVKSLISGIKLVQTDIDYGTKCE